MSNFMDNSSLVELLLTSDDDYEPYGMAASPSAGYSFTDKTGYIESQVPLHLADDMDRWLGE